MFFVLVLISTHFNEIEPLFVFCRGFFIILTYINAALNPVFYSILPETRRKILLKTLLCRGNEGDDHAYVFTDENKKQNPSNKNSDDSQNNRPMGNELEMQPINHQKFSTLTRITTHSIESPNNNDIISVDVNERSPDWKVKEVHMNELIEQIEGRNGIVKGQTKDGFQGHQEQIGSSFMPNGECEVWKTNWNI